MRIKTICPESHGGCGREHFLDLPDGLDAWEKGVALQFAKMTGCRPCSIWQKSRFKLENVQKTNQQTIWKEERRRDHIRNVLTGDPRDRAKLEGRLAEIERVIQMARGDLLLAVREIGRLDDARKEQLEELQEA